MARTGRVGMPAPKSAASGRSRARVPETAMRSVELFTGAGGLALGIENAGFAHDTVVERDADCCDTIRENQSRGFDLVKHWRLFSGDVRAFDYKEIQGQVDLLAGGPPCQPFSIGGKHRGPLDRRDMFPEVVRALRELKPRAFLVENVRGLLREAFAKYFGYVLLQMRYPDLVPKPNEDWSDHQARLERHHTKGREKGLQYNLVFQPLNAADYGAPQKRERVLIVGFRSDLGVEWSFPLRSHSLDALLRDQWVTGTYWDRHRVARRARPEAPSRFALRIERLRTEQTLFQAAESPWLTVRDAISDLPDPERGPTKGIPNHVHNPGARSYVGHTGSALDEPAKTLKAGDHGVPGGENTLLKPDGSLRYFTVRESARLQTFPDEYVLHGAWTEAMRQLGNAVPVRLGQAVAVRIADKLAGLRPTAGGPSPYSSSSSSTSLVS
jgi:DNA (cytosine-5)-methyltransferase 1